MSKHLVIVESPTKAKTIGRFLGKDYKVTSSFGHLRDLPKSKLGVDVDNDFEPEYVIPIKSKKQVAELKKLAKNVEDVILATDEDREGEAIAWHLLSALDIPVEKTSRIAFHEITKEAIEKALSEPHEINQNLVNAQQARRILDRLVGYKLSPFLWKKITYGLSAGRVQSVAVRLVVEREELRKAFKSQEYWSVSANFETSDKKVLETKLHASNGKALKKFDLDNKKMVDELLKDTAKEFTVTSLTTKEATRKPTAPFATSTLQQAANQRLGYSAKQTMRLAQQLYEGVLLENDEQTGLITYMRTDSLTLADSFIAKAKEFIINTYGTDHYPNTPNTYKAKSKLAQEAHEAIRPTDPTLTPKIVEKHLNPQQHKLYTLIWQRTLSSQMVPATMKRASIDITDNDSKLTFRANGQIILFKGYLAVWPGDTKELTLPDVKEGDKVSLTDLKPEQHFTEPPARYSDASLVKALEEHNIGRPSTYAPTIATIIDRGYVIKDERRLEPTDTAFIVNKLLVEHFKDIVDFDFTADMEENLDKIASGEIEWKPMLKNFYIPFMKNLEKKEKELDKKKLTQEKTDEKCPDCGKELILKVGRFGKFYACTGYPDCKYTAQPDKESGKQEVKEIDEKCPECDKALVKKHGRFGEFIGCSGYPDCRFIRSSAEKLNVPCPACGEGEMATKRTKRGKPFYGCDKYPKCDFAVWQKPVNEKCPTCSCILVFGPKDTYVCSSKDCSFKKDAPQEEEKPADPKS